MTDVSTQWREHSNSAVVVLRGELDLSNVPAVGESLLAGVGNDSTGLVADLSGVTYLDSAGVQMLLGVAARLKDRRQHFTVALPQGSPIERLLKITGFGEVALVVGSVDEAFARR